MHVYTQATSIDTAYCRPCAFCSCSQLVHCIHRNFRQFHHLLSLVKVLSRKFFVLRQRNIMVTFTALAKILSTKILQRYLGLIGKILIQRKFSRIRYYAGSHVGMQCTQLSQQLFALHSYLQYLQ